MMPATSDEPPTISKTLWARGGKRVFDMFAAALLLILLSPLLLAAGLLVKLTSRGPLFFIQERAGRGGAVFRVVKFRTMRGGRTPDPKELVPLDHPDITRIGWLLRRLNIDELPQLTHVLSGDMSLVGPRPTLPDQVAAYDDFRRQRLLVRPGITGLAQVNGSTAIPWDERILFDIAYVRRCSLRMDLGILLRTKWVLLAGEGRYARPFKDSPYASYVTPPEGYNTT
ncbi:MAG: sugar transferase [Phycisphaerales bacterium]|nr:MAG: sugar transferase [Phycisphaerales bacterium]